MHASWMELWNIANLRVYFCDPARLPRHPINEVCIVTSLHSRIKENLRQRDGYTQNSNMVLGGIGQFV